jgi:hypothetical protein
MYFNGGQHGGYYQQSYTGGKGGSEWFNISAIDCFEGIRTLILDVFDELVWVSFNSVIF